jgi:FtsP/CotA-like multicopper oxidase with cupredoxin domain
MNKRKIGVVFFTIFVTFLTLSAQGEARIDGLTGTIFNFTAKSGSISMPDGQNIFMWGFANGTAPMQHPGPTLIVNQGATVTINLTNQLSVPTSIVFPGQEGVVATGGVPGLLTQEAAQEGRFNISLQPPPRNISLQRHPVGSSGVNGAFRSDHRSTHPRFELCL